MAMCRQMRTGVVVAIVTLLVSSGWATAGQWTEDDFAHRIPTNYPVNGRDTVVGGLATYIVQEGDTMLDVGRHFDLGYNEMVAANPGVDPWLPPVGEVLLIPTEYVLPEASHQGIVVNIPEMRLYYFHGNSHEGSFVTTYPVGLGRDDWRTPQGSFRVRGKTENPTWVIPESIRAEHIRERGDDRAMIPGGAPDNPLGFFRLELTMPLYMLHGSNMPWGVGMQVSHGCIRLYNEDIAALFHEVRVGTPGEFVYQPVKVGIRNDVVYVEVQQDIYALRSSLEDEAQSLLARHGWTDRFDSERLRQALADRSGIPVAIERDRRLETAATD